MSDCLDVVIIGGGLSGLSTAHFLKKMAPDLQVTILEQAERVGGAVRTFAKQGFQGEWGPHGFLDNTAESQELLHDTGLYQEAQAAPLGDFYRYVCHQGKLVRLPQSPGAVLTTPLVSCWGKIRALADLWKVPLEQELSIGQWVEYRFGKALLPLVDAAVTGSFAGDFTKLSIDAVMPGVRKLEQEAGSVLRGLLRKKKAAGNQQKLGRLPAMLNFPAGMERLIAVLSQGKTIEKGTEVRGLRHNDNWELETSRGLITARELVMAVPVNVTLRLLSSFKSPPVASVPVARIINVVMGFGNSAKVPYGFGYLAPEREARFTLGAMFTSHMFPDRAPQGEVLIEALVGGRRHPERLELADDEIVSRVYQDLGRLLELPEAPHFVQVLRPEHGIPQIELGHPALLEWRAAMEQEFAGLRICGFGWDGIGMNDMIKSAKRTAAALRAGAGRATEEARVKPVYF